MPIKLTIFIKSCLLCGLAYCFLFAKCNDNIDLDKPDFQMQDQIQDMSIFENANVCQNYIPFDQVLIFQDQCIK